MRFNRIAYRESFDSDLDVRAGLHDVFIPTGDKSYSAEAGMHRPEGAKSPHPPPANRTPSQMRERGRGDN